MAPESDPPTRRPGVCGTAPGWQVGRRAVVEGQRDSLRALVADRVVARLPYVGALSRGEDRVLLRLRQQIFASELLCCVLHRGYEIRVGLERPGPPDHVEKRAPVGAFWVPYAGVDPARPSRPEWRGKGHRLLGGPPVGTGVSGGHPVACRVVRGVDIATARDPCSDHDRSGRVAGHVAQDLDRWEDGTRRQSVASCASHCRAARAGPAVAAGEGFGEAGRDLGRDRDGVTCKSVTRIGHGERGVCREHPRDEMRWAWLAEIVRSGAPVGASLAAWAAIDTPRPKAALAPTTMSFVNGDLICLPPERFVYLLNSRHLDTGTVVGRRRPERVTTGVAPCRFAVG